MSIKSKIRKLEKLIDKERQSILLENGEVIKITVDEARSLLAESVGYLVDKDKELSELAKKVRIAKDGQGAFVNTVKSFLTEEVEE